MQFGKAERNAIHRAVAAGGLEPAECRLEEGRRRLAVIHELSNSYFGVSRYFPEPSPLQPFPAYRVRRVVGDRRPAIRTARHWSTVIELVKEWASEITEPDLWAAQKGEPFSSSDQYENIRNDPFTQDEQTQIVARLEEVKLHVLKYELSAEQTAGIERRLDDLKETSKRVGRKDWITMVYGAAFGMVVDDLVPAKIVQEILAIIMHGVAHLFGFGGPLPPLPP